MPVGYRMKENSYIYLDTTCGKIKGLNKGDYALYKGIRYATARRWENPQVVTSWQGEYDATKFGSLCCQYSGFYDKYESYAKFYYDQTADKVISSYSEDCLFTNIWAPKDAKNAPVAVFIHGGSFVSGGNNAAYIQGEAYCKRGVVFASINYRMNAFGNAREGDEGGNFMLRDQIAALRWMHENIAAFGGNPDKITVIGESAGALSIQCLLYSPIAKGLFTGAVLMSGGGNLEALHMPAAKQHVAKTFEIMKEKFGVKTLAELKDTSAKAIFDAWTEVSATDQNLLNHNAKPFVDGEVIPAAVGQLMKEGATLDVPCIFGFSSEDMWPFILYTAATEWAAYHSKLGRSPIYAYYMDRQLPGDAAGAYHACDLWYMFDALDMSWRPFTQIDYRIADNLVNYVTEFVKTGNPNHGSLVKWEPLTHKSTRFLRLGDEEAAMYQPPVERLMHAKQNTEPFPGMYPV